MATFKVTPIHKRTRVTAPSYVIEAEENDEDKVEVLARKHSRLGDFGDEWLFSIGKLKTFRKG